MEGERALIGMNCLIVRWWYNTDANSIQYRMEGQRKMHDRMCLEPPKNQRSEDVKSFLL